MFATVNTEKRIYLLFAVHEARSNILEILYVRVLVNTRNDQEVKRLGQVGIVCCVQPHLNLLAPCLVSHPLADALTHLTMISLFNTASEVSSVVRSANPCVLLRA